MIWLYVRDHGRLQLTKALQHRQRFTLQKITLRGERFMNEYQPYDYILHAVSSQPGHTFVDVWDSKYEQDIERFATHGCSRLYPHVNGTAAYLLCLLHR